MYVARVSAKPLSKQTATQLAKALARFSQSYGLTTTPGLRLTGLRAQHLRQFSSTPASRLRDYFPEAEKGQIFKTEAAWRHPEYVPLPTVNEP